jgi:hypothetical protein
LRPVSSIPQSKPSPEANASFGARNAATEDNKVKAPNRRLSPFGFFGKGQVASLAR